jgi:hypothetical protein
MLLGCQVWREVMRGGRGPAWGGVRRNIDVTVFGPPIESRAVYTYLRLWRWVESLSHLYYHVLEAGEGGRHRIWGMDTIISTVLAYFSAGSSFSGLSQIVIFMSLNCGDRVTVSFRWWLISPSHQDTTAVHRNKFTNLFFSSSQNLWWTVHFKFCFPRI